MNSDQIKQAITTIDQLRDKIRLSEAKSNPYNARNYMVAKIWLGNAIDSLCIAREIELLRETGALK